MGRFLLVLLFRLLLLSVGGALAALAGVAIAMKHPDPTPEKPLAAQALQGVDRAIADRQTPSPAPPSVTVRPAPAPPTPQLTAAQRNKLATELKQLQAQLKTLQSRPADASTQTSRAQAIATVEKRIQAIEGQLKGSASPRTIPAQQQANQLAKTSFFADGKRMEILPADALFEDNKSLMRPEARLILDAIASQLRNYPGATIRIAAYTDNAGEATENRQLSFQQAQAIQKQLSSQLGDRYHWLAIGYGEGRPLPGVPNDTDLNRQRNRRIEIAVD